MKKLSIEMLRLTSDEVLQRSQMKKITGGYTGCLDTKCGSKNPNGVCCPQNTCSSPTDGFCVLN